MTASAFAAEAGNPVLLVGPDQLPASAEAVMAELGTTRSLIIGGTAAVSGPVEQAIRQTGVTTLRVGGFDRYSTARATAQLAMQEGVTPVTVWVATGRRFADALTASAATGTRGVLLLTAGDPTDTAEQVLSYVGVNRSAIDEIVLIGGTAAIDPAVETLLAAVLG